MEFWRRSVFYEIYMKSFQDSNGDGLGDFKGLTSRLDYLVDLGIDGIWLTPFYPSPQVDNGYDVSDYCDINPDYGDMTDFRAFMKAADSRGIKVIIDLVLNHSSTEHAWFKESRSSKTNSKRDYYIWREKPNNWESFFGGSAWEMDELTGEYYYHSFAKEQADLNWANEAVRAEIEEVLAFW
ncbi:glucohydrolase, partial [Listeria monocytogenes]